jgi:hypothetical protein
VNANACAWNPHSPQIFLEKSKVQSCFNESIWILIVLD